MRFKPAAKKKRPKQPRAHRPTNSASASESAAARLERVLEERRDLAFQRSGWDLLAQRAARVEIEDFRRQLAAHDKPRARDDGLSPVIVRRRGPSSTLSDEKLAQERKDYPPGALDNTGKVWSRSARAARLGVSRWVLARRAPDLARPKPKK